MADLSVKIGNLTLKNPVLTASGTFGYGLEFSDFIDLNRLGGFVVKGTTPKVCRNDNFYHILSHQNTPNHWIYMHNRHPIFFVPPLSAPLYVRSHGLLYWDVAHLMHPLQHDTYRNNIGLPPCILRHINMTDESRLRIIIHNAVVQLMTGAIFHMMIHRHTIDNILLFVHQIQSVHVYIRPFSEQMAVERIVNDTSVEYIGKCAYS